MHWGYTVTCEKGSYSDWVAKEVAASGIKDIPPAFTKGSSLYCMIGDVEDISPCKGSVPKETKDLTYQQ